MDKKKLGIIIGAVLVVIGIVIGFVVMNKSNEPQLTSNLEQLGKNFYEDYYYTSQEKSQKDVKEFVKRFENTGIKVNLENISKLSKIDKKLVDSMVNNKTNKKCDEKKSVVTIYPKKPYGKTDYKIEVKLECGFDKK